MKIIIIIHKHNDDVSNYKLYALGYRPTIALARNEETIAKKKFIYVQCTTYINSEIYWMYDKLIKLPKKFNQVDNRHQTLKHKTSINLVI